MALSYSQDHNMWIQRVTKEILTASKFNMPLTGNSFYPNKETQSPTNKINPPRPVSSKSLEKSSKYSRRSQNFPKNNQGHLPGFPTKETYNFNSGSRPDSKASAKAFSEKQSQSFNRNDQYVSRPISQKSDLSKPPSQFSDFGQSRGTSLLETSAKEQDEETLKVYIKELEEMLKAEQVKRIQSEDKLKKLLRK